MVGEGCPSPLGLGFFQPLFQGLASAVVQGIQQVAQLPTVGLVQLTVPEGLDSFGGLTRGGALAHPVALSFLQALDEYGTLDHEGVLLVQGQAQVNHGAVNNIAVALEVVGNLTCASLDLDLVVGLGGDSSLEVNNTVAGHAQGLTKVVMQGQLEAIARETVRAMDGINCIIVQSLEELSLELKKYNPDEIFVVGGAMFYKTMLPYCSEVLVTKVQADGGAEVFYENLDQKPEWKMISESEEVETNGYKITFTVYKNSDVKQF